MEQATKKEELSSELRLLRSTISSELSYLIWKVKVIKIIEKEQLCDLAYYDHKLPDSKFVLTHFQAGITPEQMAHIIAQEGI